MLGNMVIGVRRVACDHVDMEVFNGPIQWVVPCLVRLIGFYSTLFSLFFRE